MLAYPDFSIEPITEGLRIFRAGTVREELPLLGKCGWVGGGIGLNITLGEPNGPFAGSAADADFQGATADDMEELQGHVDSLGNETFAAGAEGNEKLDPATLLVIAQLFKMLLDAWKKRRES